MADDPISEDAPAPDPTQPTREQLEQLAAHQHALMMLAVDAVHINAVSVSRLVGMEIQEVSRLCVSASCRSLEKLMERYDSLKRQAAHTGEQNLTLEARMRREIHAAAEDLHLALQEGVKMADTIRASLGDYGPPQ